MTLPEIYVHTADGTLFNVTTPDLAEINIDNISYQLAMQCRFNGAVKDYRFYSVAEHCIWGSYICKPHNAFAFLMHDAQEAYISDQIRPIKRHDAFFNALEARIESAIHRKYKLDTLSPEDREDVKNADNYMGYLEAQELLIFGYSDAGRPVPLYNPRVALKTQCFGYMSPRDAAENFRRRFSELADAHLLSVA